MFEGPQLERSQSSEEGGREGRKFEARELMARAKLGFEAVTVGALGGAILYAFRNELPDPVSEEEEDIKQQGFWKTVMNTVREHYKEGVTDRELDKEFGPRPRISAEELSQILVDTAPDVRKWLLARSRSSQEQNESSVNS